MADAIEYSVFSSHLFGIAQIMKIPVKRRNAVEMKS